MAGDGEMRKGLTSDLIELNALLASVCKISVSTARVECPFEVLTALVDEHLGQWRAASATIAIQISSMTATDPAIYEGVKPMLRLQKYVKE